MSPSQFRHAPRVEKVRKGFNHPLFIEAQCDLVQKATAGLPDETRLLFTAHSIPMSMSDNSNYVKQLTEASRLVADGVGHDNWELVYQSRSGPPQQPWLEPDICDRMEELIAAGDKHFVVVPIGFISDHMEVLFDLDTEAKELCDKHGVGFTRVPSLGTHPSFIKMIRQLLEERLHGSDERPFVGTYGASHDVCPVDCCLYPRPQRPSRPAASS